jgi:hypothetical protein
VKYRVYVRVPTDPQEGYIEIETANKDDLEELVEVAFEEDPDRFVWDEPDCTKMDYVDILRVAIAPKGG